MAQEGIPLTQEVPVGKRAVRGAVLLTISTYAAILLGIIARKILAILLTPEEFGHISTALSFVDLIFAFGAFSFSSAIINARENLLERPLDHLRENIFILTLAVGIVATTVAIVLAWLFPPQSGAEILLGLISIYAVQRFVASLDTFYTQILERQLDYKRISIIAFVVNVVLHAASVLIAMAGYTLYAIPVATIISTAISMLLHRHYLRSNKIAIMAEKPLRLYNRDTMKWLWLFGGQVMLNRLFESWLYRVDNLLVFKLMNYAMLGFYSQAFMIAQMSSTALAPIVSRVSIATYAEVQHEPKRLEEAFAVTNFFLVRLLVPAALFYYFTAPDLIRIFLSSKWYEAAMPLAAMAGFVMFTPLFENGKMLLGARLKLKEISITRSAQLVMLVGLLLLIGKHGLWAVGLSVSIVAVVGYLILMTYVKREISLRAKEIFYLPVLIGIAALFGLFVFERWLSSSLVAGFDIETSIMRVLIYLTLTPALVIGVDYLLQRQTFIRYFNAVRARL
jgi:teichuronic acid exporter